MIDGDDVHVLVWMNMDPRNTAPVWVAHFACRCVDVLRIVRMELMRMRKTDPRDWILYSVYRSINLWHHP